MLSCGLPVINAYLRRKIRVCFRLIRRQSRQRGQEGLVPEVFDFHAVDRAWRRWVRDSRGWSGVKRAGRCRNEKPRGMRPTSATYRTHEMQRIGPKHVLTSVPIGAVVIRRWSSALLCVLPEPSPEAAARFKKELRRRGEPAVCVASVTLTIVAALGCHRAVKASTARAVGVRARPGDGERAVGFNRQWPVWRRADVGRGNR